MDSQFFFNGGKTRLSSKKSPIMINGVMVRGTVFVGKQLLIERKINSEK